MNIETKFQIAIEIARRAAVRSGVKGDEAIAAFVAADPAVVALEARAPISKSSAIDGATS